MADSPDAFVTMSPAEIRATMGSIKKLLLVGALFVVVGYLLLGMAIFLELTQFHSAIDAFVATHTGHSLAGGGPDRAGMAALNADLAALHAWPSTLLWLKLGGIGHILVGIFVALAAIVRTLTSCRAGPGPQAPATTRRPPTTDPALVP
jgi:small-conductance mechanosensitive channel